MQLETLVDRHDTEIMSIRDSINEIATDLQLLVKDHKFLADKMQEIGIDVREALNLTLALEEKFKKIDILEENNHKLWDTFINRWLRIVAVLVPVITALIVIYFK